jgi:chromosome segregation protein
MYLKRIELEGFKSFADRTVVPVQRGLTGIVGPNGCGKSNVVDALLWVLGERSAKALRADAMEDVIFKGAEGRAAAPYAMVEIVLGDDQGQVVEAGGEVAVGRRLFKTGESEFLLNGRKVRRKDVKDLLMDTGLGVRGYMVLAQGKIDAVLAANPAERRSVFEEAAGISRYKERKKETERKLAGVALDLSRVDDVLEEVQKAVRSLRYQAGKAKRFLEMRDRYRELRVRVGLAEQHGFAEQEAELRVEADALAAMLEALRGERADAEQRMEKLSAEEDALRGRHDALRAQASENKERVAGLEERVHGLETRAGEADQRRERDLARLHELVHTGEERAADEQDLSQECQRLVDARDAAEVCLAEAESVFAATRERARAVREQMEGMRKGVLDSLAERTRFHNHLAQATRDRSEAEGGSKARERRLAELDEDGKQLGWDHEAAEQKAQLARQEVVAMEGQVLQLVEEQEHLRGEAKGHAEAAGEARRRAAASQARIEALIEVEGDGQGLPQQVREALSSGIAGVRGLLLEDIAVASPWDRLLEDMLGRLQHALWANDRSQLSELSGAAFDLFFPGEKAAPLRAIAGAIPLRDRLQGEPARLDALCAHLGAVHTVQTASEARALAVQHTDALFLSADGELHGGAFARTGMLTDGSAGMLARRNAREEASRLLVAAEGDYRRAAAREEELNARLAEISTTLADAEASQREAQAERARIEARLQESLDRRRRAKEERDALERELRSLQAAVVQATAAETEATRQRDEAEDRRIKWNAQLDEMQEVEQTETGAFDVASQRLQEARIEANRLRQAVEHLDSRLGENRKRGQRESEEVSKLRSELDELARRADELRAEAEQARTERTELLEKQVELTERVGEAHTQLSRASETVSLERSQRSGETDRLDALMEKRQTLALDVQRAQMAAQSLLQGLLEEFGQGLEELAQGLAIDPRNPLMQAAEASPGKQPAEPVLLDLPPLQEELGELKRKIEAIGAVNLDAVAELEEREERENFLVRERDDLNAARANLKETLEELDGKCRERFLETFKAVQGNFEHIFRRLFRGGRATLELAENEDPLEAGIDINVRPPGKELRSINLLSGGERTMTALALLLSVFQSRPSPFCLLDEVDAALDDSNVERFIDAVRDFTGDTQFVVVTHNRITMSRCERLFGVTMRKRGVSMVVSVELSEIPEAPGERMELTGDAIPTPDRAGLASEAQASN